MKSKKRYLVCFLVFVFVFVLNVNQKALAYQDNKYHFSLEHEININDLNGVYINDNLYITYDSTKFNIYASTGNLSINDTYLCSFFENNRLFVSSSKTLYIINLNLLSYKEVSLDFNISSIFVDEYIYLVGDLNNNPCIYLLNNEGDIVKSKVYDGKGFATFKTINKVNNNFIITGEKDAFFDSQDFLKVGNMNDIKSFIFIIDKTFKKLDDYYFNEYTSNETISEVNIDNNINIILSTSIGDVYYQFDLDLSLVNYQKFNQEDKYMYIPNILEEKLFIKEHVRSFEIGLLEDNIFTSIINIPYKLNDYYVCDGLLVLNYNNKLNLYSEYHIDRLDSLILTKLKYEHDSTNHFEVNSFFETLTFKLDHYSPFHMHMISGEYLASYEATNSYGSKVSVTTDVIVKDFVNIIDGGIYNTGTMLQFFGEALLNEEVVHNGHTFDSPGDYELILTDVNNNTNIYKFKVIDNYYKDNDHYVIDVDYILNKEEELIVEFELSRDFEVKYFIINNKVYTDFNKDGNKVYLRIKALSEYGYQNIFINSIVSDNIITINKDITILSKKTSPTLDISTTSTNDLYQIVINYEDSDNTFVDLYFKDASGKVKSTYLKDATGIVQTGKFVLSYELGDGCILEEELFSVNGSNIMYDVEVLDNKIVINIKQSNSLNKIIVNNQNIYKQVDDNINLYIIVISIISSIIIILITSLILIIKRKRRKVNRI